MKSTKIIAALLIVISTAAFATEGEKKEKNTSKVEVTRENHIFKLTYQGVSKDKVTVRILNENNSVVFAEEIKKYSAFVRPYNFKELPKGAYTLEVIDTNGTTRKSIITEDETISTSPVVKLDATTLSDKYRLTILNQGKNWAYISVFDNRDKLLYSKSLLLKGNYCELYNVAPVKHRGVYFVVEINGSTKQLSL